MVYVCVCVCVSTGSQCLVVSGGSQGGLGGPIVVENTRLWDPDKSDWEPWGNTPTGSDDDGGLLQCAGKQALEVRDGQYLLIIS